MVSDWKSSKVIKFARYYNLSNLKGIKRGQKLRQGEMAKIALRSLKNFGKRKFFKFTIEGGSNFFHFACERG